MAAHDVIHELDMKNPGVLGDSEDRTHEIVGLVDTDSVAVQLLSVATALVSLCMLHDVCSVALIEQIEEVVERGMGRPRVH